jgi:anti-sigma regulatory factor (Ser/Thr protein kinase)
VTMVRTQLPTGTMAVPVARRFATETLRGWRFPTETIEIAELVVSELVGNAVVHGDVPAEMPLTLRVCTVRMDVRDRNPAMPTVMSPTPEEDRHRGLLIVSALTSAWGTERTAAGKSVWAELAGADTPGSSAGGDPRQRSVDDRSMSG